MSSDVSNSSDTIFEGLADPFAIPRKEMIPSWIKFFCYLFLVLSVISVAGFFLPMFYFSVGGIEVGGTKLGLYGLHSTNEISLASLALVGLFVLKAVVGYALLAEKDWAVKIGMIDGGLGILICCATMLVLPFFGSDFRFSWELFFLFPYQARLWRIKPQWEENAFLLRERLGIDRTSKSRETPF